MRISDCSSDVCSSDLEDLRSWKGKADASIVRLIAGPVAADRIGLRARFDGTAVLTRLAVDADMARLRGPDFAAGTVNLEASDRKSVGSGKSVSVRVDLGGRRLIKKNNTKQHSHTP